MNIKIIIDNKITLSGSLHDTATAQKVYAALPIKEIGSTWGGEIYFESEVAATEEKDARDVLEAGELAYWPPMQAICIFYGPTPASRGDEIRAAGAVNVFGKVTGDLSPLKGLHGNVEVTIQKDPA